MIVDLTVVPDDFAAIQKQLCKWIDAEGYDFVATTGGTGIGPRDGTPEAVGPLLQRLTPGITTEMLTKSLQVTPMAMLSRPVSGVRGKALVITLPGSPKGACECLRFVLPSLNHALDLLRDDTSKVATTHTTMQASTVHSTAPVPAAAPHVHVCPHKTGPPLPANAPPGVAHRLRVSPHPMVPVEEAIVTIVQHVRELPAVRMASVAALGHVLAADITAPEDHPQFPASVKACTHSRANVLKLHCLLTRATWS